MNECERKVNTVCDFLPSAKPTNDNSPWEMSVAVDLHRAVMRGAGFWKFITQQGNGLEEAMAKLTMGPSKAITGGVPTLDFVGDGNQRYLDMLFDEVLAADRMNYRHYLRNLLAGVGATAAV